MNFLNKKTRNCLNPWIYKEVSLSGKVKACCRTLPYADSINDDLNNKKLEDLKNQLIRGKLSSKCLNCHLCCYKYLWQFWLSLIFVKYIKRRRKILQIELNTNCNIKCIYCALQNQLNIIKDNMGDNVLSQIEKYILSKKERFDIYLNGHGEATIDKRFFNFSKKLIAQKHNLYITTNFAKKYSDEEIEMLSNFFSVQISIDSLDNYINSKTRSGQDVNVVQTNLNSLIFLSNDKKHKPKLSFAIAVHDFNILDIPATIEKLIVYKPDKIVFYRLIRTKENAKVIDSLYSKNTLEFNHDKLKTALKNLKKNNVKVLNRSDAFSHYLKS